MKLINKQIVVVWNDSSQREFYGTPTGIVKSYDEERDLYRVEHVEPDGHITTNDYAPEELSQSLLLRLLSKAQQNKIERIITLQQLKQKHYVMYCIMWMCISTLSMYWLLA